VGHAGEADRGRAWTDGQHLYRIERIVSLTFGKENAGYLTAPTVVAAYWTAHVPPVARCWGLHRQRRRVLVRLRRVVVCADALGSCRSAISTER
jgi:hypothetical protein